MSKAPLKILQHTSKISLSLDKPSEKMPERWEVGKFRTKVLTYTLPNGKILSGDGLPNGLENEKLSKTMKWPNVAQVYLSVVILRINQARSELDCEKLREVLSYNNLSMIVDLRNFMVAEGVTIAALFVTSAVVQVVTGALPFFLR